MKKKSNSGQNHTVHFATTISREYKTFFLKNYTINFNYQFVNLF